MSHVKNLTYSIHEIPIYLCAMYATWMYIGDPEGLAGMGLGIPLHVVCMTWHVSCLQSQDFECVGCSSLLVSIDILDQAIGYLAILLSHLPPLAVPPAK